MVNVDIFEVMDEWWMFFSVKSPVKPVVAPKKKAETSSDSESDDEEPKSAKPTLGIRWFVYWIVWCFGSKDWTLELFYAEKMDFVQFDGKFLVDWLIIRLVDRLIDCLVDWLIDWLVGWCSSEISFSREADTACCCIARGQIHGVSAIQTGACEENGKFFGQRLWRRRKAAKHWYVEHFCRFRRFYRTWHGYEWKLLTKAVFFLAVKPQASAKPFVAPKKKADTSSDSDSESEDDQLTATKLKSGKFVMCF